MRGDRAQYPRRYVFATFGRCAQAREGDCKRAEWQSDRDDAAAVDHQLHVVARAATPAGDLREGPVLHLVTEPFVAESGPRLPTRVREHPRVLPRAVVVEPRGRKPGLMQEPRAPASRRLVRAAGEIALFESDRLEHSRRERDVLWFA